MIKIGIIAAGHLGKIHISLLKEIKEFEVIGFFDKDKGVSKSVEKDFGIKSYPTCEDLIKQCNALDIVSPTPSHFEYAKMAIKAGKHVFIEKPITNHPDEAKTLVRLCHEAGVVAQVGHVEQFNPAFLAAKPFISRPLFISAERFALYNPRGTDVSVVMDLMIHDIDLVLGMVKSNVKKVQASASPIICETDDIADARIEFNNGTIAHLTVSRVALHNKRTLQIFQKDSFLSIDLLNKTLTKADMRYETTRHETSQISNIKSQSLNFNEMIIASRASKSIVKSIIAVKPINAIKREFELFAQAILNKIKSPITLEDAYLTMKVTQQIMDAIR